MNKNAMYLQHYLTQGIEEGEVISEVACFLIYLNIVMYKCWLKRTEKPLKIFWIPLWMQKKRPVKIHGIGAS